MIKNNLSDIMSQNIGKAMYQKNLSQGVLAKKTGLTRMTINRITIIGGNNNPKISTLVNIASALNVDFPKILSRSFNPDQPFDSRMTADKYMELFSQNVLICNRGRPQKMLSQDPGIRESTISQILTGKNKNPKLSSLNDLSEQLDISLSALFTRGE